MEKSELETCFSYEYSEKWKTKSWKTSQFDQCASEKSPRFSTPGFGYSAKWKTPSGKTGSLRFQSRPRRFDSDTCMLQTRKAQRESFVEVFDSCSQKIWKIKT